MVRRVLFVSVGFAPLVVLMHYALDLDETVEFVLSAAALIPLAWLIGEATEHAAEHTGPGIGGFLNATFGNAPELIIALLAVNERAERGRPRLADRLGDRQPAARPRLLAPLRRPRRDRPAVELPRARARGCDDVLLLIPSIPGWDGDPDGTRSSKLSIPVAIVLLLAYVAVTWYSLRRHAAMHVASDEEIEGWSLRLALVVLGGATVVTALVAEILVGSLEVFSHESVCREFFVSAVIVAIVGNAAEHGGAVVVAARGKIKLAAEIALASSAQVAVFLIPAVTLLALLIDPLALSFRKVEIAALGVLAHRDVDPARRRPLEPPQGRDPDRGVRRRRDRLLHRRRPR